MGCTHNKAEECHFDGEVCQITEDEEEGTAPENSMKEGEERTVPENYVKDEEECPCELKEDETEKFVDMHSTAKRAILVHARWVMMSRSLLQSLLAQAESAAAVEQRASKLSEAFQTAKLWDNLRFERVCEQGQIAWLKVGFLRKHWRQRLRRICSPLPRRQDLPDEALVVGAPNPAVSRWVVSHPWLAEQHPDIHGDQLTKLIARLDDHGAQDQDVVFLDYHSMFQVGIKRDDRTAEQYRLFKASLKAINMLYTSSNCKVIVLAEIPKSALRPDEVVKGSFIPDGKAMVRRNATPYHERGWCWFELLISVMFQTCVSRDEEVQNAFVGLLKDLFSTGTWKDGKRARAEWCLPWLWARAKSQSIPSAQEFQQCLARGDISFIKVGYLHELAEKNLPWPQWEDIPEHWKWSGDPEKLGIGAKLDGAKVYTISYPWNPDRDPEWVLARYNRDIVDRLEKRDAIHDDLVFVRRMSVPCRPTTDAQKERCQMVEEVFYWLFSSPRFRVIVVWDTPKGLLGYHERGRCVFELLVAVFSGTVVLDEEALRVIVITKLFIRSLGTKRFTRGQTDMRLVGALLERLILERNGLGHLAHETSATIKDYHVEQQVRQPSANSMSSGGGGWFCFGCGRARPRQRQSYFGGGGGCGCFPSSAQVVVRGHKEPVLVHQLSLGDEVLVRGGRYEPVMLFVHRNEGLESRVRVLATADGSTLKLTPDHVVPLANGQRLAAQYICVGDVLFNATGRRVAVESAAYGPATGEIHFKTPSGEVCVDGILCCTYNEESAVLSRKQQQKQCKSLASLMLGGRRWLYKSLALVWGISNPLGLMASHLVQTVMCWRYPTDITF